MLVLAFADTVYYVLFLLGNINFCRENFKCLRLKFLHLPLHINSAENIGKFSFYILRILNSRTVIIMATWIRKKLWNLMKLFYYPSEFIFAALDASPAAVGVEAVDEHPSSM